MGAHAIVVVNRLTGYLVHKMVAAVAQAFAHVCGLVRLLSYTLQLVGVADLAAGALSRERLAALGGAHVLGAVHDQAAVGHMCLGAHIAVVVRVAADCVLQHLAGGRGCHGQGQGGQQEGAHEALHVGWAGVRRGWGTERVDALGVVCWSAVLLDDGLRALRGAM